MKLFLFAEIVHKAFEIMVCIIIEIKIIFEIWAKFTRIIKCTKMGTYKNAFFNKNCIKSLLLLAFRVINVMQGKHTFERGFKNEKI